MSATPVAISKAERAYEALRRAIVEGDYQPGERLVLQRIAREMQISVVPVREAIRRLEAEGYADFERNVGARVATVDVDVYRDTMETLAILEGAATALAAPMLSRRDLQSAARLNDRMAAALEPLDPRRFTALNRDFHRALHHRCENRHLLHMIDREWSRLAIIRRSTFAFVPERAPVTVQEHRRLLERLAAGAPPHEIERLLREHRMATVRAFLERCG